jgi:hypothetical protein
VNLCGLSVPSLPDLPDAGEGMCCMGAAALGPARCTCWNPVYDLEQADPDPVAVKLLDAGVQPATQPAPCADCAYRLGSPEREGDKRYSGDQALLERIVASGERFWCHQGMRKVTAWRHPSGAVIPVDVDGYAPPKVGGVPWQADGQPGLVCGGWAARRRAYLARTGAPATLPL